MRTSGSVNAFGSMPRRKQNKFSNTSKVNGIHVAIRRGSDLSHSQISEDLVRLVRGRESIRWDFDNWEGSVQEVARAEGINLA